MGCCSSGFADGSEKVHNTVKNLFVTKSEKRRTSKSYFNNISNESSLGASSACTSQSRPCVLRCCNLPPLSFETKVKIRNLKFTAKQGPPVLKMLTICDDFNDALKNEKHQENKSFVFKLEKIQSSLESTPVVSEEWGSGWKGTNFIVEIEETASVSAINKDYSREDISSTMTINSTTQGPKIIVRTEEILIVGLVLMLWVGAIILFFNRWGKIRMLEPYQPKFQQQHRASCPLSDIDPITHKRSSVTRMSMAFISNVNMPPRLFAAYNPTVHNKGYSPHSRLRQNSVFVGPSPNKFLMPKPPRKTRSAMDLHSMVFDENAEQV